PPKADGAQPQCPLRAISGPSAARQKAHYSIKSSARARTVPGMVSPSAFAVLRLITNGSAGQGLTAGSSGKSRGKSLLACDRKVINRTSCIVPSENPIRWIRLIGQNHRILKSDVRGLGQVHACYGFND